MSDSLDILVVGAGLSGLAFAINARLQGHSVRVFEKRGDSDDFGDILAIQSSALRTIKDRWPDFWPCMERLPLAREATMCKPDGTVLITTPMGSPEVLGITCHRSELHNLLLDYALKNGVDVQYNKSVKGFFEAGGKGGVVLDDDTEHTADLVVAADGVGSSSNTLILGRENKPVSSGYGCFRGNYPLEHAKANPVLKEWIQGEEKKFIMYLGPGVVALISKSPERVTFQLTHEDAPHLGYEVPITDVLPYLEQFSPLVQELIKVVPSGKCFDWKLRWRDPQENWVSPQGRVVQIGDAAHAFIPWSGYGASMGIEDAASLAGCLAKVTKDEIPLALRVHNNLRFERTACAQKVGWRNRENWNKTGHANTSESTRAEPHLGSFAPWLVDHDVWKYTDEKFEACAKHITTGAGFRNTNSVPGYTYKPWTVKELTEATKAGVYEDDDTQWLS